MKKVSVRGLLCWKEKIQGYEHDMTLCRIYMFVSLPGSPAEENPFFWGVEDGEQVTVKLVPLKITAKAPCLERKKLLRTLGGALFREALSN